MTTLYRDLVLKKPQFRVGGTSAGILFWHMDNETLVDVINKSGDLEVLVSY